MEIPNDACKCKTCLDRKSSSMCWENSPTICSNYKKDKNKIKELNKLNNLNPDNPSKPTNLTSPIPKSPKRPNPGKRFEANIRDSCKKQNIFYHRVSDIYIHHLPTYIKKQIKTQPNKYDCFIFNRGHLFCLELKSTALKSIPFNNIQEHQIKGLLEESSYEGVVSGFIVNFRKYDYTCFVCIKDFIKYWNNEKRKKNSERKESLSVELLKNGEVKNVEILCKKMKVNWEYDIEGFIEDML